MPETWANEGPDQYPYDMEPDGNYKLKVEINRECNAIEAGNSHASGKALKVTQGETEILDQMVVDKTTDDVLLAVKNSSNDTDARSIKAEGYVEIVAHFVDNPIHTGYSL